MCPLNEENLEKFVYTVAQALGVEQMTWEAYTLLKDDPATPEEALAKMKLVKALVLRAHSTSQSVARRIQSLYEVCQ